MFDKFYPTLQHDAWNLSYLKQSYVKKGIPENRDPSGTLAGPYKNPENRNPRKTRKSGSGTLVRL